MAYVFLALAILCEVGATTLLKLTDGFSRLWPTAGVVAGYGAAFWLLGLTLKSVPLGVTYAIWAGVGTAAIAIIGLWLFGEALTPLKVIGIVLITAGVIALNISPGG